MFASFRKKKLLVNSSSDSDVSSKSCIEELCTFSRADDDFLVGNGWESEFTGSQPIKLLLTIEY